MKMGKTSWIFLFTGILVIAFLSLGSAYRGQQDEQENLNQQITSIQQQIDRIPIDDLSTRQSALNTRLMTANSNLETVKKDLTQPVISINAIGNLYEIAEASKLELVDINSLGYTKEAVNKLPFTSLPLTLKVKGTVPDILYFINSSVRQFPLLIIKSVSIDVPTLPADNIALYIWSVDSGTLPSWANLNPSTGAITGTPEVPGTYYFTLRATDKTGNYATRDFTLDIRDPVLTISGDLGYGGATIPYSHTPSISNDPSPAVISAVKDLTPTANVSFNIYSLEEQ